MTRKTIDSRGKHIFSLSLSLSSCLFRSRVFHFLPDNIPSRTRMRVVTEDSRRRFGDLSREPEQARSRTDSCLSRLRSGSLKNVRDRTLIDFTMRSPLNLLSVIRAPSRSRSRSVRRKAKWSVNAPTGRKRERGFDTFVRVGALS